MEFRRSELTLVTYESLLDQDPEWALREGSMHFENESLVHKTLRNICRRLDDLGIDYAVVGGMAMFLHGFRRFTEDVDLLVTAENLQRVHDELEGRGYVRPFEKSKNLRDSETRVKIDFLVTGQFPGDGKPGPVAFPDPKNYTVEVQGLKLLQVPRLVELKLASGQSKDRLKDLGDVQELIRTLDLPLDLREQIDPSLRERYTELWDGTRKSGSADD